MEGLQLVYDTRGPYLWLASVIVLVFLVVWVLLLHQRMGRMLLHYRALTRGVSGRNFDDILQHHIYRLDETADKLHQVSELANDLDETVKNALQRIGIVRFNPFTEVGGDQSFAVALLDAGGSGLVISSLFGRHESRVYAKSIQAGQSKYQLSEEEEEAIHLALGSDGFRRGRVESKVSRRTKGR